MTNIIASDIYRLRKGAAARNTLIGLLGTVIFVAITFAVISSGPVMDYLYNMPESMSGMQVTVGGAGAMGQDFSGELDAMLDSIPNNAGSFGLEMVSESFLPFFFLPLIIAVFGADFSAGTYRNTLSYESNRTKVYLSKLLLSAICCLALSAVMLLFSWLLGGLLLGGFAGSAPDITRALTVMVLQLPINLGIICFGHCLIAYTKKSGSTIAAYLLTLILLSVVVQVFSLLIPISYIQLLDWSSAAKLLANYQTMSAGEIAFTVIYGLALAGGTTALGLARYKHADMA